MRSPEKVFETAINVISCGFRPARRAAAAICSCTRAMFSTIDINKNHEAHNATRRKINPLQIPSCGLVSFVAKKLKLQGTIEPCDLISDLKKILRFAQDNGKRLLLRSRPHMIAVGGAGSSGRPAFASGTRIMTNARIASAAKARKYDGVHLNKVTSWFDPTKPAMTRPHSASPAIKPEAVSTPALSTRAFCASL